MLSLFISLSLLFHIVASVAPPSFSMINKCSTTAGSCVLTCGTSTYDLTSVITSGGSQKLLLTPTPFSGFEYGVLAPLCSSRPTNNSVFPAKTWTGNNWKTALTFSQNTDVWQLSSNGASQLLGLANETTWKYGTVNGQYVNGPALQLSYTNGDYCGVISDYRHTIVYFACDPSVASNSVRMTAEESPTCHCKRLCLSFSVLNYFSQII